MSIRKASLPFVLLLAAIAMVLPIAAGAAIIINDSFADANSQNHDLANNSLRIFKGRSDTARIDAPGSVTFNVNTTSAEAFWAFFTESGAPVRLNVGDQLSVAGTFSLTGFVGGDIRFGLFDSQGTRNTTDLTGGMNNATFAGDPGYAAQFNTSGSGSPFGLYRRTNLSGNNPFNTLGDFTQLSGTGATVRQTLGNDTAYTLVYSIERVSETETRLTISVTGGALPAGYSWTAVESSTAPVTAFDYFGFRFSGTAFARSVKFTNWRIDYSPSLPVITSQPQPSNLVVQVGSNVTMSVAASGNSLSYRWHKDGAPINSNASALTPTLNITNAQLFDAGSYTAVISNPGGSTTSHPVTLGVSTEPVPPPPSINTQPTDATAVLGTPAVLSVAASGDNLYYQWFKNGALIPGATQRTLAFAAAQVSDSAAYTVVVSNSSGSVTSAPARLLVVSQMSAVGFAPAGGAADINIDAPLRITFDRAPQVGNSGRIRIFQEDGTLVDSIDLAVDTQPAVPGPQAQRNIGGASVSHNYHPIITTGHTAAIYPRQSLAYNQTYYVTLEPGVVTDSSGAPFAGISDANVWRFATKAAAPPAGTTSLTVAADGTGDFDTVQGAIDFVPQNNTRRVVITVRRGAVTGIVYVRSNKPFITVRGEDREGSLLQYANNNNLNPSTVGRAAFGVDAADFTLENLTLVNTTPSGGSQAEAFRGNNQRITLNRVNLKSFQDTLLLQGTGFVTDSYIEGDVDFMWGAGAVFFQNSELKMLRSNAYYTQVRNGATVNGQVYVNCRLTAAPGVTGAYLTRIDPDDFPFSQVVLINTQMDAHVRPDAWRFDNPAHAVTAANYPNIRFWEYNSRDLVGNLVDITQRHPISRQLGAAEAVQWSNPSFVLGGWTPQTTLTAGVSLSNLTQSYTGSPILPAVATDPPGLAVTLTYNGGPTPPTATGSYNVVATVNDANYQGFASGTLVINPVAVSITLGNLSQVADGRPKAVSVGVTPANAPVVITYDGSPTPPTEPGRYSVVAAIADPNFRGGASATLSVYAPGSIPIKAFPGAEGAGERARGGRGGDVYHVTNLNDSGPGSLREGIRSASGPRTIVFDVSGTINLNSRLTVNRPFLTIAGQTAPGDGITVAGWPTVITNTNNVVIRYLRFRVGDLRCPAVQDDALWVDRASDVILDHVSASWSVDETLSVTDSNRVTVQWSFITESLKNSCHEKGAHGYGSLIRGGSGLITYHHNLYAHHDSRNPRLGDNVGLDFVNNVVYDWGGEAGYSGEASEGTPRLNFVGNYLIAGPSTPASKRTRAFNGGSTATHIYQSNNLIDSDRDGQRDGADTDWAMIIGSYTRRQPARFDFAQVSTDDARTAYDRVLATAGSSLARDAVDARVADEVRNELGSHINSQSQVGGFPQLESAPAPADTDRDGMPDAWESERGLNPADASDGRATNASGYTNLETYLSDIVPAPGVIPGADQTPPVTTATLSHEANAAGWHNSDVTLTLSAGDEEGGSGLREIIYSVNGTLGFAPGGQLSLPFDQAGETIVTFSARDEAGNAEPTQTITVRLDKSAPVIQIAQPSEGAFYRLGQEAHAVYTCADDLSGTDCVGTVPSGALLDTSSVGARTFGVSATDRAGNSAAASVSYTVGYGLGLLSDPNQAKRGAGTIPVRLQLLDSAGVNRSAADLSVRAVGVSVATGGPLDAAEAAGNANPGGLFRYEPTIGTTGGYVFNLRTGRYAPGRYLLHFTVGDAPYLYSTAFRVE
jgi:pectin methylesterase-like acyl-CoA thioesterase/pectate lyase